MPKLTLLSDAGALTPVELNESPGYTKPEGRRIELPLVTLGGSDVPSAADADAPELTGAR